MSSPDRQFSGSAFAVGRVAVFLFGELGPGAVVSDDLVAGVAGPGVGLARGAGVVEAEGVVVGLVGY